MSSSFFLFLFNRSWEMITLRYLLPINFDQGFISLIFALKLYSIYSVLVLFFNQCCMCSIYPGIPHNDLIKWDNTWISVKLSCFLGLIEDTTFYKLQHLQTSPNCYFLPSPQLWLSSMQLLTKPLLVALDFFVF